MVPEGDAIQQHQIFESYFRGPHGDIVYWNKAGTYGVTLPDGSTVERRATDYLQTVDDFYWTPMMLQGPHPIYLVSCGRCRQPSLLRRATHGLCTLNNARRCVACGGTFCPRHTSMWSDGSARCVDCAKTHRIKSLLLPIFFESE
jgi:hypothetical protein